MKRKDTVNRGGLKYDKYLTVDEVTLLSGYVCRADKRKKKGSQRAAVNAMIVRMLLQTGVRAAELCDLRIRDLPYRHGRDEVWVDCGKGGVDRTIEIEQGFTDEISRFIKLYRKGAKPGSRLFVNERGGPLSYRSLYSRVFGIGIRAGLRKLHPHMLRHTFLTLLYNVRKDIRYVQTIAGHASPNTTAVYTQTLVRERREQIDALDMGRFFA